MSRAVAGGFLIGVPVLFNVGFGLLAQRFDYPDVLRRPTHEVLSRFRAGGSSLIVIWWMFGLSAVLFAPLAVLLAGELADADGTLVALSVLTGVLAALVQVLGLIRWPFLVPYLAREAEQADADSARGEAIDVVFQSLHRYLGVAVGEHLGYALTGAWTILTGAALVQSDAVPGWLGVIGVIIGLRSSSAPSSSSGASSPRDGSSPARSHHRLHCVVAVAGRARRGLVDLAISATFASVGPALVNACHMAVLTTGVSPQRRPRSPCGSDSWPRRRVGP